MNEEQIKALNEALEKNFDGLMSQIEEKMDEKLDAKVEELGLKDVKDKFANAKKVDGEGEEDASEKIAKFVQALSSKDYAQVKDMSEGTDSAGGYLVPTELYKGVMRIIEDYGITRKFATIFKMTSDTLNVPTVATSVSVYWPGEGTAGTASQPVYGNAALLAKTCVGLTVMSNELLQDATVSVVNHLMELFAEAIAGAEDSQALAGTGSPFTGILSDSGVNVVTMGSGDTGFTSFDLDDLRDLITQVKSSVLPSSAYIMHRSIWAEVQQKIEDSKHVSTFQNPIVTMEGLPVGAGNGMGIKPAGYLWGYPVYLNDNMPAIAASAVSTKYLIFGSLKKGLFMGDREKMTMSVSEHATVGSAKVFEENQIATRITERVAITVGLPTAFAVLKTAAS